MIKVQEIIIDENIPFVKFACNLSNCKGACCTMEGGAGAPLLDDEIILIEKYYSCVKHLLPQEHVNTIEANGLYEGYPNNFTTMCYKNSACVFVTYDKGIAKCAFEVVYNENKIPWKKPISCHLFPIRVDNGILQKIRYEKISECNTALTNGLQNNINLYKFLEEPLTRAFGKDWYDEFKNWCNNILDKDKIKDKS